MAVNDENLIIYHTNDLHGRLSSDAAKLIGEILLSSPGLLFDAGDAVSAGNLGIAPGGEPVLRRMTQLGYTAMAVGNREFHPLPALMRRKLADAGFPVLCSNLEGAEEMVLCRRSLSLRTGGRQLAVMAVCPDMLGGFPGRKFLPFSFSAPASAVRREMESLRGRADIFILLSHLGLKQDIALASEIDGLDLIIGGHSHLRLAEGIRVRNTLIVQAGCHAGWLGMAELTDGGWRASLMELNIP